MKDLIRMYIRDFIKSTVIIAYFVPFANDIANSNIEGEFASEKWTIAYEETNEMFSILNDHIIDKIEEMGYKVAGLGTFGVNNMLITKENCLYKRNKSCLV